MTRTFSLRVVSFITIILMVLTLAFSVRVVKAENDNMTVEVSVSYNVDAYSRKGDSEIFVKDYTSDTLTINMPKGATNDEIEEAIEEPIKSRLEDPEDVSDTMKFEGWSVKVVSKYDEIDHYTVYAYVEAQYSGNKDGIYDVGCKYVREGSDSYYPTRVEGIIYSNGSEENVKKHIVQEVEKAYEDVIIPSAGFEGWEIKNFDKATEDKAGTAELEIKYSKSVNTVRVAYLWYHPFTNGDYPFPWHLMTIDTVVITDSEPSEDELNDSVSSINIPRNIPDGVSFNGWSFSEIDDREKYNETTIGKLYYAFPEYSKFPFTYKMIYENKAGDTVALKEITTQFYDADRTLSSIIDEIAPDKREDTTFMLGEYKWTDPIPSMGGKSPSNMTLRDAAFERVNTLQFFSLVGSYDDRILMPLPFYNSFYIERRSSYNGDEIVQFLQSKGIWKTLEQLKQENPDNPYYQNATRMEGFYYLDDSNRYWNYSLISNEKNCINFYIKPISSDTVSVNKGEEKWIDAYGYFTSDVNEEILTKDVEWTSSNEAVVRIEQTKPNSALIKGVEPGKATVTARIGKYSAAKIISVPGNGTEKVYPFVSAIFPLTDLKYTGETKNLAIAGRTDGGTLQYGLGTETTPPDTWSQYVPYASEVGTYYVWYRVVGNDTYMDLPATYLGKPSVILPSDNPSGGGSSGSGGSGGSGDSGGSSGSGSSGGGGAGGSGGSEGKDPSPAPDKPDNPEPDKPDQSEEEPTPEPDKPEPTPNPTIQAVEEYTNPATGEVMLDKIIVPESDSVGTKIVKQSDGSVTVTDSELGEAKSVSPAVFAEGQVYRLYNPHTGEHFYTKNPQERDALASMGWSYEADQTTKTISASEEGAAPVYRVYNPNSGLHHYTTDKQEALMLKTLGWSYEGISLYAYDKHYTKGTPTYRVYCPFPDANGQNQHIYTTSIGEVGALVALGYIDEGIAWRVK